MPEVRPRPCGACGSDRLPGGSDAADLERHPHNRTAAKRPGLWATVFGYHEVFHALVLLATAAFLLVVAIYVVPYPRP